MASHQPGLCHICRAATALLEHDEARRLVGLERTSPKLRRRRVAGRRERPGRAALLPDPASRRLRAAEFDQQLRVAASPTALCLRVECCATGMMRPLAVPWRAVRDDGFESTCGIPLGQLALGDDGSSGRGDSGRGAGREAM